MWCDVQVVLDTDRVSLVHGDSHEVMSALAAKSVDIVLTDPPYSPHVHQHFGKERRADGVKVSDELDFPPMTDQLIGAVSEQLVRVCKGWIILFGDERVSYKWGNAVTDAGGAWVRAGVWVKTNPKPQMTGDRPGSGIEHITICHAQPDTLEGRRHWDWNGGGHAATWRGGIDRGGEHPNQKPLWLLQSLLGMFAPANAICLDPYIGSGSTALAATATERLAGESPADTSCKVCAKKILEQYQPPLPENVSVIGVEGNLKWLELSMQRLGQKEAA